MGLVSRRRHQSVHALPARETDRERETWTGERVPPAVPGESRVAADLALLAGVLRRHAGHSEKGILTGSSQPLPSICSTAPVPDRSPSGHRK